MTPYQQFVERNGGGLREWRAARAAAFDRGKYRMRVPDVTTGRWDKIAWCNWVEFNDPALRGFDDRSGDNTP